MKHTNVTPNSGLSFYLKKLSFLINYSKSQEPTMARVSQLTTQLLHVCRKPPLMRSHAWMFLRHGKVARAGPIGPWRKQTCKPDRGCVDSFQTTA